MTVKWKTTTLSSIRFQTILNQNETFFIDISMDFIRSLRKCTENLKAIGLLEKKLCCFKVWIEMQYTICRSVRQEGGLRPTTVNNLKTRIWTFFLLFQVCCKFLQVFAPYHPPFYHILIYSHNGLTVCCVQLMSILCYQLAHRYVNSNVLALIRHGSKSTVKCTHCFRKQTHPSLNRTRLNN